jgi:hypothetical protein
MQSFSCKNKDQKNFVDRILFRYRNKLNANLLTEIRAFRKPTCSNHTLSTENPSRIPPNPAASPAARVRPKRAAPVSTDRMVPNRANASRSNTKNYINNLASRDPSATLRAIPASKSSSACPSHRAGAGRGAAHVGSLKFMICSYYPFTEKATRIHRLVLKTHSADFSASCYARTCTTIFMNAASRAGSTGFHHTPSRLR